ncbi:DUF523 domain-containing protein [Alkaliphilus pronyensis]|uniref:DUF523 domain-containing protein n=1 Tax=Alkaliphilus pronyensis TaxID=1482732 RepID=A0A6I0FE47_9FIRM|nr:CD3072 family TudS-related putative desulfidase [Alkaliphilus pronyensis]KAB3536060.1 DUF523 domain-containing protein [Alkaliphilus pronyensis]
MKRNKRIVIVAHCILNVNSKVVGLAQYGGAIRKLVTDYVNEGIGIIQLPCPEITFLGLERWGMTKNQYDTPSYRKHCKKLIEPYVEQIIEYLNNGYIIEEIVGIDGSPSCGVSLTCSGYKGGMVDEGHHQCHEISGSGIMIEELKGLLKEHNVNIPMSAISEKDEIE